jgi:hypothetical protein
MGIAPLSGSLKLMVEGSAVEVITVILASLCDRFHPNFLIEFTLPIDVEPGDSLLRVGGGRDDRDPNHQVKFSEWRKSELYFKIPLRVVCRRLDSGLLGDRCAKCVYSRKTISRFLRIYVELKLIGTSRWS